MTIIDCGLTGRAFRFFFSCVCLFSICIKDNFRFEDEEDGRTMLRGVTIRRCNADYGGAVITSGSQPLLFEVAFVQNTATRGGGAVYWSGGGADSAPTILNCTFAGNRAPYGDNIASAPTDLALTSEMSLVMVLLNIQCSC